MIYVDIPERASIENGDGTWVNVGTFKTKEEAVTWIRSNIGHCDDHGNIGLLSNIHSDDYPPFEPQGTQDVAQGQASVQGQGSEEDPGV